MENMNYDVNNPPFEEFILHKCIIVAYFLKIVAYFVKILA